MRFILSHANDISSLIDSKVGFLTSFQKRGRLQRKLQYVIDKNKLFDYKKKIFFKRKGYKIIKYSQVFTSDNF